MAEQIDHWVLNKNHKLTSNVYECLYDLVYQECLYDLVYQVATNIYD